MILLTIAAAALAQWTGPRTEEYVGPGYFCGGGFKVRLAAGDRALVLPQGRGAPAARVILAGRNVSIWTGAQGEPGPVVAHYGGTTVTQQNYGSGIGYLVSDDTAFGLRVTSESFRGGKHDRWFFAKADFADGADRTVNCLSARSY